MDKIIETLSGIRGRVAKSLIPELSNLTEEQVKILSQNYYITHPKSLVSQIKSYLKTNARLALKEKEKAEEFEKKYGKTVSLFKHILDVHRKQIKNVVTKGNWIKWIK